MHADGYGGDESTGDESSDAAFLQLHFLGMH